jgi:hypothetical protein
VQFVDIELGETVREEDAGQGRRRSSSSSTRATCTRRSTSSTRRQHPRLPLPARQGAYRGHRRSGDQGRATCSPVSRGRCRGLAGHRRWSAPRHRDLRGPQAQGAGDHAEISGAVELHSDKRKGKMTIRVISDSGIEKDHHVPQDKQLLVHAGDYVRRAIRSPRARSSRTTSCGSRAKRRCGRTCSTRCRTSTARRA